MKRLSTHQRALPFFSKIKIQRTPALLSIFIISPWLVARADDNAVPAAANTAQIARHAEVVTTPADDSADAPHFSTDSQWEVAGYNAEEIIYIITILSHDSRILRCRTQLQGYYLEDGKQISISDQQTSTVFPDQQVRVGNWTGLDQNAGANFTVKCRPL